MKYGFYLWFYVSIIIRIKIHLLFLNKKNPRGPTQCKSRESVHSDQGWGWGGEPLDEAEVGLLGDGGGWLFGAFATEKGEDDEGCPEERDDENAEEDKESGQVEVVGDLRPAL